MRVLTRVAAGSLVALAAAFLVAVGAAAWLRSAAPSPDLLWRLAPTTKVAAWGVAAAHGAPVEVAAEAGLTSERLRRIGGRLGDVFGRDLTPEVGVGVSLRLAPLTILLVAGAALVLTGRTAEADGVGEAAAGAAVAALVYGTGAAALAVASVAGVGFEARFVRAAAEAGVPPGRTFFTAAGWAGALVFAGALTSPAIRGRLHPVLRSLAAGWWRGLGAGAAVSAVGLAVWTVARVVADGMPTPRPLVTLGGVMLAPNAVASALVLSHGTSMRTSLVAGPLEGWTRLDYLNMGPDGGPAGPGWWLFLLAPLAVGLVAGRTLRRAHGEPRADLALAFGGLWAVTLAGLALLLRVRVLSSFSLAFLQPGGEAAIDPWLTLLLGFLWGTATAYGGMLLPDRHPPPSRPHDPSGA